MEYEWKAVYNDGEELLQHDGEEENLYKDIDRSKLDKFIISERDSGNTILVLHLNENKRLIVRRRIVHHLLKPEPEEIVWLVGWQEKVNGQNVQQISFIFEDGHIEVVDKFYEGHDWFYPVNFRPEEAL